MSENATSSAFAEKVTRWQWPLHVHQQSCWSVHYNGLWSAPSKSLGGYGATVSCRLWSYPCSSEELQIVCVFAFVLTNQPLGCCHTNAQHVLWYQISGGLECEGARYTLFLFECVSDSKPVGDLKHQRAARSEYPVIACFCGLLKLQDSVLPFFGILLQFEFALIPKCGQNICGVLSCGERCDAEPWLPTRNVSIWQTSKLIEPVFDDSTMLTIYTQHSMSEFHGYSTGMYVMQVLFFSKIWIGSRLQVRQWHWLLCGAPCTDLQPADSASCGGSLRRMVSCCLSLQCLLNETEFGKHLVSMHSPGMFAWDMTPKGLKEQRVLKTLRSRTMCVRVR